MLQAVTALDIVAARAKHARWCGGVRPLLLDNTSTTTTTTNSSSSMMDAAGLSPLNLPGATHPLLLQLSLPPLPRPPSEDDASFATNFTQPPLSALATASGSSSSDDGDTYTPCISQQQGLARTAKPLELVVPNAARVVAITGPNTGGKTVTLKTAGLLALMAKAGLMLPCRQQDPADAAGSNGNSGSNGSIGVRPPSLLWFDQVGCVATVHDALP